MYSAFLSVLFLLITILFVTVTYTFILLMIPNAQGAAKIQVFCSRKKVKIWQQSLLDNS